MHFAQILLRLFLLVLVCADLLYTNAYVPRVPHTCTHKSLSSHPQLSTSTHYPYLRQGGICAVGNCPELVRDTAKQCNAYMFAHMHSRLCICVCMHTCLHTRMYARGVPSMYLCVLVFWRIPSLIIHTFGCLRMQMSSNPRRGENSKKSRGDVIEVTGTVVESLPNAMFKVTLEPSNQVGTCLLDNLYECECLCPWDNSNSYSVLHVSR
jgi:hypothetical protein